MRARAQATAVQARLDAGERLGPLAGLPVAVKDSFAVEGLPRRLGLASARRSERDAEAVASLRAAGAVLIGTTAMDQLAWTMSGHSPGMPTCINPALPGRCPGGSSAGAAAAVAAGIVALALGSDSAGSTRVPATWCGVVGFKPTFGAISLTGCAPLAKRFDTAGILAPNVTAAAVAFDVLRSADAPQIAPWPAAPQSLAERCPPRAGIPTHMIAAGECDASVSAAWAHTQERLSRACQSIIKIEDRFRAPGMGTIFAAELAARWAQAARSQPPELLAPAVAEGIEHGERIAASAYIRAADAIDEARRHALSLFERVDLLALPVAPVLPPAVQSPAPVAVASAFTRIWSAYGMPAIAIPLPAWPGAGVQLVGAPGRDRQLLDFAAVLERMLDEEATA